MFYCCHSHYQMHTVLSAIFTFAPANFRIFTTLVDLYLHSVAAQILWEEICEENFIPHLLGLACGCLHCAVLRQLIVPSELLLIYRSIFAGAHAVVDLQCVVYVYAYSTAFVIASCCIYFALLRKKRKQQKRVWEQNKTTD